MRKFLGWLGWKGWLLFAPTLLGGCSESETGSTENVAGAGTDGGAGSSGVAGGQSTGGVAGTSTGGTGTGGGAVSGGTGGTGTGGTGVVACDVDGDGFERDGDGCAGDDCDDTNPSCWDAGKHGCCAMDGWLFHSEFEGSVEVQHPQPAPTSQWRLPFAGLDSVTGHDWSSGFPQDPAFPHVNVLCLVHGSSELVGSDPARIEDPLGETHGTTGFVDARVADHPGIDGKPNRVLFFHGWRDDPSMGANSRLQANWIPPAEMRAEGGEIYVAYWMKLQPNLYEVHTAFADEGDWHSRWRNVMEWRHDQSGCADANYRFSLVMETYNSDYVFWRLGKDDWGVTTAGRPDLSPPVDRWFFLEVYTLRHPSQGRLWVGIDGKTLFDAKGVPTMPPTTGCYDGGLYYQFLKLYGDLYNYEDRIPGHRPPYQFWQYYDGLRLHDGFPVGHCAIDSSCAQAGLPEG